MAFSAIPYTHYEPSLLEPVYPQQTRQLEDLAVSLTSKAGQLTGGLHPIVRRSLGALVRSINCYYSNLIDGNGRVVRLFSHAYFQRIGIGNSLWSVSRGFARKMHDYRSLLARADLQRQNDYDGRGNLTMAGLIRFCEFFLLTCIDQIDFMTDLLEPTQLLSRIEADVAISVKQRSVKQRSLLPGSFALLKAAFLEGEFARGRAAEISGYGERQARSVLKRLVERGLLVADSPKGAVRLGFPTMAVERWLPRLWAD